MIQFLKSKKILMHLVTVIITVSCSIVICSADCTPTRDQAVQWLYSQDSAYIDLDGAYGAQCSDFVSAYMNWLYSGDVNPYQGYGVYNASYYPTVASWNPGRWTLIENYAEFVPEPGDIFVSTGGDASIGHVGVVLESYNNTRAKVIDQNSVNSNYVTGHSAYIHDITWSGSYTALYYIRYNYYGAESVPTAPTAPTIKCNTTYALVGSTVTVSWDSVSGATDYSYYLTEYPVGWAYTTNRKNGNITSTSISFDDLESGEYSMFVHANNSAGSSGQSNWISFTVAEEEYVPTETKIYNGHIYSVYDYEMSWSFAEEVCEYMGGHLVTVADQSEQNFLATLISSGKKAAYWIGADNYESSAESQDGQWKWVTGEPFSYTAWKEGEPNANGTRGEREHFAEIRKTYSNLWNDVNNISKTNKGFVIEIEPQDEDITETIHYNGNTYKLIDRDTTWSGAKAYCELLGGHLATIETSDEYKKICDFLSSGKKGWYYLGGKKTDSQGNGKWIDDSSITKTDGVLKWSGYEAGNCLFAYKKSGTVGWMGDSYVNLPEIHCLGFVCEIESKITLDTVKVSNSAVSFDLQSKLDGSATAVIAYYTSTGQLLQCDTQEITLESGTKTIDTTPPTGYATLKIFLLGEGNLPLCEAYTQSVK